MGTAKVIVASALAGLLAGIALASCYPNPGPGPVTPGPDPTCVPGGPLCPQDPCPPYDVNCQSARRADAGR